MKTKRNLSMQVKELSDEGSFEGLLSVYNSVDLGGDMIVPGAFKKTIQEHGSQIPMLWQHKADVPIGTLILSDGADSLSVKGQLLMEIPEAKNAYLLLKAGIVKGLSIGYTTVKDSVENGVRVLKECRLWEGSVVTFPMQELALISTVKHHNHRAEAKGDFTEELNEQQLQDMGYQMRSALFNALGSLTWAAGMTNEERVAAAQTTIQQFSETYLEYFPKYLDWLAEEYGEDFMTMSGRPHETKAGRVISAATNTTLTTAHEHMKSAMDLIYPLIDDEAEYCDPEEEDCGVTSKAKAGKEAKKVLKEQDPEPVVRHSEFDGLIERLATVVRVQ